MGRSAEMWFDAQEAAEQQEDTLAEELWQLGCAMNAARRAEVDPGYAELLADQADYLRKARRENGV